MERKIDTEQYIEACPFCGVRPDVVESSLFGRWLIEYSVDCNNELCLVRPYTITYESLDSVIKAWNTRKI